MGQHRKRAGGRGEEEEEEDEEEEEEEVEEEEGKALPVPSKRGVNARLRVRCGWRALHPVRRAYVHAATAADLRSPAPLRADF